MSALSQSSTNETTTDKFSQFYTCVNRSLSAYYCFGCYKEKDFWNDGANFIPAKTKGHILCECNECFNKKESKTDLELFLSM